MNGIVRVWVWSAVLALMACSTSDGELTPAEMRQEVMEEGTYCCTHDGAATTPECEESFVGAVYLQAFSDVDDSGHGDACGWILKK